MSCIISGEYRPPSSSGVLSCSDTKVELSSQGQWSCHLRLKNGERGPSMSSFHASNPQCGDTPPSMLHHIPHGKQEQRSLLISVLTHRHYYTTPDMKTHVAGGYTSCSRFDVETGKYMDANNTGHSKKLFTQPSNCGAQALHTLKKVCLTKLCQLNCSPALLLLKPSKSY